MASVTVFTAARMQQIEDTAIDHAYMEGYNLFLRRHNMEIIDLGNIRGAKGDKGDTGEVSEADLATAFATEKPWNVPWGRVAAAYDSTRRNDVTLAAAIGDLTVTFTAVADRRYKISGRIYFDFRPNVSGALSLHAFKGSTDLGRIWTLTTHESGTFFFTAEGMVEDVPGAGSVTYSIRGASPQYDPDARNEAVPGRIIVEDAGPV